MNIRIIALAALLASQGFAANAQMTTAAPPPGATAAPDAPAATPDASASPTTGANPADQALPACSKTVKTDCMTKAGKPRHHKA